MTTEIKLVAESLQKQSHEYVNAIIETNPKMDYQSALNAWFYLKLAELIVKKSEKQKQYK
jgi:hypothetical protein